MTKVAAVDLFCGVGGLSHGLIKTGIDVLAGIDVDGSCRFSYEKNNSARFIERDIGEVTGPEIKRFYPKRSIKVLAGCAPCQPFSTHTQKKIRREKDPKWKMLYSFRRLIKEVKPDIVTMENVVQLSNQVVFEDFIRALERHYYLSWKEVYCPDYGIPQVRKRLVLLASKLGPIELIPPTHLPSKYRTVRDAIGGLDPIEDGESNLKDALHRASKLSSRNKKRIQRSTPGGTWHDWDKRLRAPCHRKATGSTYVSVYSRMEWDKPSPTITTQFNGFGTGRFGHPEQDRAISIREGAMLQTFPKYYKLCDPEKEISFKRLGVHIGNAVPVKLGKIIGKSIIKHVKNNA
jgi:DNA (cytosine-5)-methyltransferase 1